MGASGCSGPMKRANVRKEIISGTPCAVQRPAEGRRERLSDPFSTPSTKEPSPSIHATARGTRPGQNPPLQIPAHGQTSPLPPGIQDLPLPGFGTPLLCLTEEPASSSILPHPHRWFPEGGAHHISSLDAQRAHTVSWAA
ncbi:uncharacterized protein BO80DRAFT_229645 [Aspergillus ibericus CBS 121593]|uniref:Uncharacterized protein n=1 Tax=Aspergillus ibericus CBS 121593 TaxID=1448316 RepID=A0A395GQH6_9EURO|nr:hypothetical protein BO80DRAFT_229645 [Aspergillus ibericus CBS 121593]RAK96313.1 hypothetical protein BO80DRAFT_229645 [Aspergillus ibericus CBS 121593]